jgi:CO/xanthine dehydrogenase FAD-binding subunit
LRPFKYVAPKTVSGVLELLSMYGHRARCLAGGTDLLVQTRVGRFELDAVIDIKNIPETNNIDLTSDGLYLGSAVPCYQIYENQEIYSKYPGIMDAATLIGGIQIQSRASIGGNLCNASPSADAICPLIVHSATASIAGPGGIKNIAVEDFCTGPGQNMMDQSEFLIGIHIPNPPKHSGAAYQRFIPRNEMDIAVVGVASSVQLNSAGDRIETARLALAAVGPTPLFAKQASDSLAGKPITKETFAEAADLASQAASPIADMRGTVQQRKDLVRVLARRTLEEATERARRNHGD